MTKKKNKPGIFSSFKKKKDKDHDLDKTDVEVALVTNDLDKYLDDDNVGGAQSLQVKVQTGRDCGVPDATSTPYKQPDAPQERGIDVEIPQRNQTIDTTVLTGTRHDIPLLSPIPKASKEEMEIESCVKISADVPEVVIKGKKKKPSLPSFKKKKKKSDPKIETTKHEQNPPDVLGSDEKETKGDRTSVETPQIEVRPSSIIQKEDKVARASDTRSSIQHVDNKTYTQRSNVDEYPSGGTPPKLQTENTKNRQSENIQPTYTHDNELLTKEEKKKLTRFASLRTSKKHRAPLPPGKAKNSKKGIEFTENKALDKVLEKDAEEDDENWASDPTNPFSSAFSVDEPPVPNASQTRYSEKPANDEKGISSLSTSVPKPEFQYKSEANRPLPEKNNQPKVHSFSFEAPESLESSEESQSYFLTREERKKSKKFSSLRLSIKNRPQIPFPGAKNKQKGESGKRQSLDKVLEDEDLEKDEETKPDSGMCAVSKVNTQKSDTDTSLNSNQEPPRQVKETFDVKPRSQTMQYVHPSHTMAYDTESKPRALTPPPVVDFDSENKDLTTVSSKKKKRSNSLLRKFSFNKTPKHEDIEKENQSPTTEEETDGYNQVTPLQEDVIVQVEKTIVEETPEEKEERRRQLEQVFIDIEGPEEKDEPKKKKQPKFLMSARNKFKKKKDIETPPEHEPLFEEKEPELPQSTGSGNKMKEMKGQVVELQDILHGNVEKLYEREENIDLLEEKADHLATQASLFEKTTIEVKEKMKSCSKRTKVILIVVGVSILVICIIVLLALLMKGSDDKEVVHVYHYVHRNGTAISNTNA